MKKSNLILATCMMLLVMISSCSSEEPSVPSTRSTVNYDEIQVENGMLCFSGNDHVKNTLIQLESDYVINEETFIDQHQDLNQEELAIVEQKSGHRENLPYEELENHFHFSSLRKKLLVEEIIWLATTSGENIDEDPDNHFIIDKPLRAILNEYCEMKIGSRLYKFFNGGYIEITDGDFEKLLQLRTNLNLALDMENVIIEGQLPDDASREIEVCNGNVARSGYSANGNHRIKWTIGIHTPPWGRNVIARTKNYWLNGNGNWELARTYIACRVWGDISGYQGNIANCEIPERFNEVNGAFSDHSLVKEWHHRVWVTTRTRSGWVRGFHHGYAFPNPCNFNSVLVWN